jgi:hypothetical protein
MYLYHILFVAINIYGIDCQKRLLPKVTTIFTNKYYMEIQTLMRLRTQTNHGP